MNGVYNAQGAFTVAADVRNILDADVRLQGNIGIRIGACDDKAGRGRNGGKHKAAVFLVGFEKEKSVKLSIGIIAADDGGKGFAGKHRRRIGILTRFFGRIDVVGGVRLFRRVVTL